MIIAVWHVIDGTGVHVAVYPFNRKGDAESKAEELTMKSARWTKDTPPKLRLNQHFVSLEKKNTANISPTLSELV